MKKIKAILALGIIALFMGLVISPATAATEEKVNFEALRGIKNISENEFFEMQRVMPLLMDSMSKAQSPTELLTILNSFIRKSHNLPLISLILGIIRQIIDIMHRTNLIRPIKTNAFILSWGFANKINPLKDNEVDLYRPFTLWYYAGRSSLLVNSRTLTIDFNPFRIHMQTGRQIGFMRNFAGIYYHRQTTLSQRSFTFFMGRTGRVRSVDLSGFNWLGQ
ncbi:MAG: hypothetical protein R6V50_04925 [Thermoplasmatota archaeon]